MKNSIVVALLIGSAALTGQLAFADDREAIAAAVADDVARPVRQGGVDGQAYWNVQSVLFMYPPAFDFPKVDKAVRYRYVLEDDARHVVRFESETPNESLSRVWAQLPVGTHRLEVLAVNAKNRVIGMAGYRRFWKSAAFCPDDYPKGVCGYDEAAKRYFDWLFEMKNTKCYLENGLPDEDYTYNAYPSKMDSALINACVNYAKIRPDCKDAALTVARRAAEHLLSLTLPPGSPLENFPRTYRILKPSRPFSSTEKQADNVARAYQGMNMLLYPASAGGAYIKLYEATGERRYLDAAIGIAETYIKLQGDDGTWYLKVWEKDGSPVAPNRLFPLHVCSFLERLRAVTGQERFRVAADKAFAFVEKGPLSNWNWEGQFEDVEPFASPLTCAARTILADNTISTQTIPSCRIVVILPYLPYISSGFRKSQTKCIISKIFYCHFIRCCGRF